MFQVADPSGKVLLSTDPARRRQFTVSDGVIDAVVDTDCEHVTGVDVDHGDHRAAVPVPRHGVYKV